MRLKRIVTRSTRSRVARFPINGTASYNVPLALPKHVTCSARCEQIGYCIYKPIPYSLTISGRTLARLMAHPINPRIP